jgi:acyl carrier protein
VSKHLPEQVFEALTEILQDVFDDGELVAAPALCAVDVPGWDSMGNVRLVLAIEQQFGIRFRAGEIGEIPNVGALVALILSKT